MIVHLVKVRGNYFLPKKLTTSQCRVKTEKKLFPPSIFCFGHFWVGFKDTKKPVEDEELVEAAVVVGAVED